MFENSNKIQILGFGAKECRPTASGDDRMAKEVLPEPNLLDLVWAPASALSQASKCTTQPMVMI